MTRRIERLKWCAEKIFLHVKDFSEIDLKTSNMVEFIFKKHLKMRKVFLVLFLFLLFITLIHPWNWYDEFDYGTFNDDQALLPLEKIFFRTFFPFLMRLDQLFFNKMFAVWRKRITVLSN